jgi:hypothetical protein
MATGEPDEVTLNTIHGDLVTGFAGVKQDLVTGFAGLRQEMTGLKVTLISGFQALPTRESSEEMLRLLRESNRLQEKRLTQLDARIREQHLEVLQVLRALADGQRVMVDGLRGLSGEIRSLASDIKALVARLDALIKGRGDGSPST